MDGLRTSQRLAKLLRVAPAVLLALFLLINAASVRNLSLTYDEPDHYRYGRQILDLNSNRFDDSKMPFSALNALPAELAQLFPAGEIHAFLESSYAARLMTVLFSMVVACCLYRWAKELYGEVSAVFALFLFTFEPNIIAHSQLITTDIFATGMMMMSVYSFWRFSRQRNWKHLVWFGLVLGLAQLAKYTAVFLYPVLAGMLLIFDAPKLLQYLQRSRWQSLWRYTGKMVVMSMAVFLINILVINLGFLFNRTMMPLGEFEFRSELFKKYQARLHMLSDVPVPLPFPYLEGLDYVRYRERTGRGFGNIYLLGQTSKEGFPNYYLVAFLFKTPIAIQAAFWLALGLYLFRKTGRQFREKELFLLAPILSLFTYFNYFNRAQIGIRFLLVIFPFILIYCSRLLLNWKKFTPLRWVGAAGLAGYLVVSTLSYFPHYIPYFNELVLDRRQAYKILADSNLDWGQAAWYVQRDLGIHPETLVDPEQPVAGRILVSANNLVGITARPETYRWLRENFEPVDTVAYAYLVYQITPEQLQAVIEASLP